MIRSAYKTIIFYIVAIFAALAAFQIYPSIDINCKDSSSFSSERVAADINIISKRPHSIEHPKERKVVANYLFHRLEQMGGDVQSFEYDSIKCKLGGYINIENIYGQFDPLNATDSTKYVLLVAHYDSRYHQKVLQDTVYSFGAADDGYGVGIILESINLALNCRAQWQQGIKVIFTDAEEHNLDGMRSMVEYDNHLLNNVNLVINVEARGVKGPALLFETSVGNSNVVELYKEARNPFAYSLTTLVYNILPNNTDFTIVKDSIPGLNFSVIDNLKYYHTDKDNFTNISLKAIEHYGLQIEPIMKEYLTSCRYSCDQALRSEKDSVFFTIPLLGLFVFSKTAYMMINILVLVILAGVSWFYVQWKGLEFMKILKCMIWPFLFFVGSLALGELTGWIAAYLNNEKFDLVGVKYVEYDYVIIMTSVVILFLWILIFHRIKSQKNSVFGYEYLFATLFMMAIMLFMLMVTVLENFFILVPVACTTAALLLSVVKYLRISYLFSVAIILLLGFSFFYCLITALTIGSLGVVLALVSMYLSLLISQYYLVKRNI